MKPYIGQVLKCYGNAYGLTFGKLYSVRFVFGDDENGYLVRVRLDTGEDAFYDLSFFSRSMRLKKLLDD
jgi:hypothetical protein